MIDYRIALPKLLPPISYDRNGEELQISMIAEANALNTVQAYATKVLNAVTPFYADELLEDWESVLGLTIDKANLYQARLERVLEKLAEVGGLSIPYFIGLAAKTGYEIVITEGAYEIFRAGINRAGDHLGSEDLLWVWRVHVKSKYEKIYYFRAGMSHSNDRLRIYAAPILETILNDLKPAFTYITFFYLDPDEES